MCVSRFWKGGSGKKICAQHHRESLFCCYVSLRFQQGCTATTHKHQPRRGFCSDCWVQLLCTKTEPTKRSGFTTWKLVLVYHGPDSNRHLLRVAPSTFTTVQMIVKFLSSLFSSRHYFLNDHQKRHTTKKIPAAPNRKKAAQWSDLMAGL